MAVIRNIAQRLSFGVERYMPNAFIFAIVLTAIAYLVALITTSTGPFELVQEYYGGFWSFLEFTMQMTLIIVTGHAIASSPAAQRAFRRVASIPTSSTQAYLSVIVVAALISYINWGLGLVGAAIYAVILAKTRDDLDYGYLVAAAYSGTWPGIAGSLSVTAPLLVNTPGHFMEDQIGIISLSQTIFSPMHLFVVIGSLLAFLLLFWAMEPSEEEVEAVSDEKLNALLPESTDDAGDSENRYISDMLNESSILTAFIVLFAGSYIVYHFATQGFIEGLTLNSMNFTLLIVGIALHGGLVNYTRAVENAVDSAAPIILQFPFYGGIQGLLVGSGFALLLVNSIVDLSGPTTYPLAVFFGTGVLNVFVPSAGGQYIVTAEILHGAGGELGVADPVIISAYTFGDTWTNMLQPFFALPLIAIAGLSVRDIWGYVLMALITFGIVAVIATVIFPMFVY